MKHLEQCLWPPFHWGVWILIKQNPTPPGLLPQAVLRNWSLHHEELPRAGLDEEEKNGVGWGLDLFFSPAFHSALHLDRVKCLGARDLPVLPSHRPSCPSLSGTLHAFSFPRASACAFPSAWIFFPVPLRASGKVPFSSFYLMMSETMSLNDYDITSLAALSFYCNQIPVKTVSIFHTI